MKGIIAIEPSGPPFHNNSPGEPKARAYGITDIPVAYEPAITAPAQIATVRQEKADAPELITCTLQAEPARKLFNFQKIPILITVAEASYHTPYDHCVAKYMQQAGAPVEFVRLEDKGLRGNGHMVMLEKNNLEIAAFLDSWARDRIQ